MTITVNTKAYNLDAVVDSNTCAYTGPAHTMSVTDKLQLRRSKSVAVGTQPGRAKAFAKFVRSYTDGDGNVHEAFAEASFSIPIGMAEADVDSLRSDLGVFLNASNGDDLVWKHDINQ